MQFIDTHIHLQDDKSNNATDIIARAQQVGCVKMICVSSTETNWPQVALLCQNNPNNIVPAFGIHPWSVSDIREGWGTRLEEMIKQYPSAIIGECGLDGLKPLPEVQKNVFLSHCRLAKRHNRPLIVHAVKAQTELESLWQELPEKFVIHGYNSKPEFLKQIIRHDGYIGLGSHILRHPQAKEIIGLIPLNKMLFETDAPYQASYPWAIKEQAEQIARLLNISMEKLMEQVLKNSMEFIR